MNRIAVLVAIGLTFFARSMPASAQPRDLQRLPTTIQSNGSVLRMPLDRAVSRRSGLSMQVDPRWANRYGYRPIQVTLSAPQPTTVDHLITIRIYGGWWSRRAGSIEVEQDFELPSGSTSAKAVISFPQYQASGQYLWWDVWVDGVRDRDLSIDRETAWSATVSIGATSTAAPSVLVPGSSATQRQLNAPGSMEFEALSLPVGDFPDRWIDYTSFDVVALSFAELELLMGRNPGAAEALRRWVHSGGAVWVGDAGDDWERLAEVAAAFELDGPLPSDAENGSPEDFRRATGELDDGADPADDASASGYGWQPARFGLPGRGGRTMRFTDLKTGTERTVRDPVEIARLLRDPNYAVTAPEFGSLPAYDDEGYEPEHLGRRRRDRPRDSSQWFVDHRAGSGRVRAFRGGWFRAVPPTAQGVMDVEEASDVERMVEDSADGSSLRMAAETRLALGSVGDWSFRHGLSPDQGHREFSNWLVPGVGLAPVTEFRVLITLFVVLIGPVNYWVLKRLGRLHLLVLTVPLAAAAMTVALFAYAVLADGFGTTVRVRSLTTLDQRTGNAACWARLSYYAGLAPAQGLAFPSDMVIYPILADWSEAGGGAGVGPQREVLWEAGLGRYTRGWLQSRTPTQYLAIRSRRSPYRIEFAGEDGNRRATNELETLLRYLVAVDEAGELFSAEGVAAGASVDLQPVARNDAVRRIRELILDNLPEAPAALSDEDAALMLMERRSRRRLGRSSGTDRLSESVLERAIAGLGGTGSVAALSLPPRSYVAVTEHGPEVEIGFARAKEEASFHVIIGQW